MNTRPTKRHDGFGYPSFAEYHSRHNVGWDMQRIVKWGAEATPEKFNAVFAAYTRPLIALVFGCSAVEGYTNYVGHSLDRDWGAFAKGTAKGQKGRPGIRDKMSRVYSKLGGTGADFSQGVLQSVVRLFEARGYLMHPSLDEREHVGESPPADVLEMIEEDFPPTMVNAIVQKYRKKILADSGVRDLTRSLRYAEILRD